MWQNVRRCLNPWIPRPHHPQSLYLDEYLDSTPAIDKSRALRQGLPPTYRMRHDAHYVDELESRRRPCGPTASPALAFPTSIPVTFALRDMSQELEGVASCFNLVATRARPLRERLGLSLARVGVQAQHARVSGAARPARRSAARAAADLAEQPRRADGARVSTKSCASPNRVSSLDLHDGADSPGRPMPACWRLLCRRASARWCRLRRSVRSGRYHPHRHADRGAEWRACELRQDAYRLSADQFSQAGRSGMVGAPGGIPAGIALAAAARIAQAHGGALDARRTEAGGCALIAFSVRGSLIDPAKAGPTAATSPRDARARSPRRETTRTR